MQTLGYNASRSCVSQREPWRHSQLQVSTQWSSTRSSGAIMPIKIFVGETLLLKREQTNAIKDCSAVAVMKETKVAGHIPCRICCTFFCNETVTKGLLK